jgi:uncharacterized protein (DUF2267 family)
MRQPTSATSCRCSSAASTTRRGDRQESRRKIRSCEEFLYPIAAKLAQAPIKPEAAVRAVFQGLKNHIAPGEVLHVVDELPQGFARC